MPTRRARFPWRGTLAFACLLPLSACDQWALMVNSDGILFVSIVSDGFRGEDRFRVRTRESDGTTRLLEVPASGKMSFRSGSADPLELTLVAPPRCRVSAPNPRSVTVAAEQTVTVAFDVHCDG
jgi:hypothetical protein